MALWVMKGRVIDFPSMKCGFLTQVLAPGLSLFIALAPSPSFAIHFHKALKGPARPAPQPVILAVPKIPGPVPSMLAEPRLGFSAEPAPSALAESPAPVPADPSGARRLPADPGAPAKGVQAAAGPAGDELRSAQERIAGSASEGEGRTGRVLDDLYLGSPAGGRADDSGVEAFVDFAKSLFHPGLAPGREPAVAVVRRPRAGAEAVPSDEEMRSEMTLSPLTNPEREQVLVRLFQEAGARRDKVILVKEGEAPPLDVYDTVIMQDAGRGRHNIYVVKKGRRADRYLVDSAHHDKVSAGHGTIDNWSGTTMVANHYQSLRGQETESGIIFLATAREEEGLLGSQAFLEALPPQEKARIAADQNLDTLGVDGTFSWGNNGTRSLLDALKALASRLKYELQEVVFHGGDADSSSFLDAGIAAITVLGLSPEKIFDIIHSDKDTMAVFSLPHYRNAFLLTLEFLKFLDRNPVGSPSGAAAS